MVVMALVVEAGQVSMAISIWELELGWELG